MASATKARKQNDVEGRGPHDDLSASPLPFKTINYACQYRTLSAKVNLSLNSQHIKGEPIITNMPTLECFLHIYSYVVYAVIFDILSNGKMHITSL